MVVVAEEHALGDLQLEPLGGEAGCRSSTIRTIVGSACDLNWTGDRLTATVICCRPFGRLGAGGPQHPFADFVDQADFLGERDELAGLIGPCSGWSQRISASNPVTASLEASTQGW